MATIGAIQYAFETEHCSSVCLQGGLDKGTSLSVDSLDNLDNHQLSTTLPNTGTGTFTVEKSTLHQFSMASIKLFYALIRDESRLSWPHQDPLAENGTGPYDEYRKPINDTLEVVIRQDEEHKMVMNPLLDFFNIMLEKRDGATLHIHKIREHFNSYYKHNFGKKLGDEFNNRVIKPKLKSCNGKFDLSSAERKSLGCHTIDGETCKLSAATLEGWIVKS
ncbi:hypothetical protein BDK51DRAFT_47460 [Blyttiomyces helicus]|uniref:Uncharacterized protein n=1 Tax=Blyttiomyces helicus TaxID=388810 RepID=A0A4P9WA16_9FUNG|nr:hypothetical protein BDK51DRAFT_47460 [Blyttiomyces helicus]|eukprot:RKO87680.1 hypothetical protein BDK51DRAFT_47460 [Blyttiomyces helicus]